jgi:hypothetical protein
VPLDPFGDKPFRYEADEGQAKITADPPIPDEALREELEIAWVVR